MKKIYLNAGHHNSDPGAIAIDGQKEADLTKELRDLTAEALKGLGVVVIIDNDSQTLGAVLREIEKTVQPGDLLIDLHFDSFSNPNANGAGVFIKDNPSPKETEFGEAFSKTISEILDIKDRGVKTESVSHRGRLAFLHGTGERFIFETCFISNPRDLVNYTANKHLLSRALACQIKAFLL